MLKENGHIVNGGIIIGLVLIMIIMIFLFYQRIKTLKNEHFEELLEALDNQKKDLKKANENIIANIQRVNKDKIRDLEQSHRSMLKSKQKELENDFLQKIRMMQYNTDNILTNYENKIPIMSFALEPSINVRTRMRDEGPFKPEDKLYRNNGHVFSFSDTDMLHYSEVYNLFKLKLPNG